MHPQGLSRKGVILLILMMFLFSSMLPSQREFDAPMVVAGENTVHGKSIAFECSNNISSGDCDHDSLSNIEEDRDGDGNWSNDDSDGDGIPNYLDEDDDNDGWPTWMECPISTEQSHDDCPGFGPVKDYLHENLYNCDLPFVHLAYASNPYEMKLFVYIEHNSTLVELLHLIGEGGANSDRSHLDGKIHWVNASPLEEDRHHRSWTPTGLVDEGSINTSDGFSRADFDEDGRLILQRGDSLYSMDLETNQIQHLGELNQSTGGGGDLIVDQHDDMFLTSHTGEIFFVQNGSLNATMIGDISQIDGFSSPNHIKGTTLLENGSLLYNSGENIYLVDGQWNTGFNQTGHLTNGEKLQIYHIHTSSDGTTGGDMASCLIPDVDQDVDSIPDYYEERVFLTNSSQQDSDADGLSDGDEVLVHGTDPLNVDTDGDGCSDGDEINNFSTSPFVEDTNGDGVYDCLTQTTLSYSLPERLFWDEVNVQWSPIVTGHAPEQWSITPDPPSWLNFDQGAFSPTPPAQHYNASFVIACSGNGGIAQATVEIEIIAPPPEIGYQKNQFVHTVGDSIEINVSSYRGPIDSWEVSAGIPVWLQFNEGNFSGIAEEPGWLNFTVTATGVSTTAGGIGSTSSSLVSIHVQEQLDADADNTSLVDDDDDDSQRDFILYLGIFMFISLILALTIYLLTREKEEDHHEEKKDTSFAIFEGEETSSRPTDEDQKD